MPLSSALETTKAAVRATVPTATVDAFARSVADLRASGLAERAVGVGDLVALPILSSIEGDPIDLLDLAADRPVVLVFYRGGWCPYCSATLRAFAAALPAIEAAGGTLMAVTPERPVRALGTARRNALRFTVAVDAGNRFAKCLGLAYAVPRVLRPLHRGMDVDLPFENGDDSHELPIPATYVLAPGGRVTWAHVDADFTRRGEPAVAVAALERLRVEAARDAQAWAAVVAAATRPRATLWPL